jgi:hypothetical protein
MLHVRLGRLPIKLIVGLVAAGTLSGSLVAPVTSESVGRPPLVEADSCDDRGATKPATPQDGALTISVTVPATAFVRVDKSGRVTAAATNTGCAPRKGYDVYVFRPDGSITLAPTFNLASLVWFGDFTSVGEFQNQ